MRKSGFLPSREKTSSRAASWELPRRASRGSGVRGSASCESSGPRAAGRRPGPGDGRPPTATARTRSWAALPGAPRGAAPAGGAGGGGQSGGGGRRGAHLPPAGRSPRCGGAGSGDEGPAGGRDVRGVPVQHPAARHQEPGGPGLGAERPAAQVGTGGGD